MATTQLEVENQVLQSLEHETGPSNIPFTLLFFPAAGHPLVLDWGHRSRIACHPGVTCTLSLLQQCFWWPSIKMSKTLWPHATSAPTISQPSIQGLPQIPPHSLPPLAPYRPLFCYCVTSVVRFSKSAHFILLTKLLSAKETTDLMINHVFSIYCLPIDIVSDRGPQFSAQFWKAFCSLIGATPSLSSSFHPQMEHVNQELEKALRCMTSRDAASWSQFLPWVEYAQNSLPYLQRMLAFGFHIPSTELMLHLCYITQPTHVSSSQSNQRTFQHVLCVWIHLACSDRDSCPVGRCSSSFSLCILE